MKKLVISIFALVACTTLSAQLQPNFPSTPFEPSKAEAKVMTTLTDIPQNERVSVNYQGNVVYDHQSDMDLVIQLITPAGGWGKKYPCVVFIQGAAWYAQAVYSQVPNLMEFAKRGYVVASVQHRPSTTAKYPAQIQDIKSAVRFLRKNANRYGIDTNNLFVWGDSSGGNLSLLLTVTADQPQLDTEAYGTESVDVNACVAYYPVTDVLRMQEFERGNWDHISENSPTGTIFGGIKVMENPDIVKTLSPITYVSPERAAQTAPIMIVTGNSDRTVPFEQSVIMADRLEECGYDYKFYKIEGADHGSYEFWTDTLFDMVDAHFRANMK